MERDASDCQDKYRNYPDGYSRGNPPGSPRINRNHNRGYQRNNCEDRVEAKIEINRRDNLTPPTFARGQNVPEHASDREKRERPRGQREGWPKRGPKPELTLIHCAPAF
jgi:hypothetical protein